MSHYSQYSNTYLHNNHVVHDIENNMEGAYVPEFTLYYVNQLDHQYKQRLPNLLEVTYPWHIYETENRNIDNLVAVFELNELFTEHLDNIYRLTDYVRTYERLSENDAKTRMYYQEITPILENEKQNIASVIEILSTNTSM